MTRRPYDQDYYGFHRPPVIIEGAACRQTLLVLGAVSVIIAALLLWEGTTANGAGAVTIDPDCDRTYTIESGDTLTGIADTHKRSVDELAEWNGIADPDLIIVGHVMCVTVPRWVTEMRPVGFRTVDGVTRIVEWDDVTIPATGNGDKQPDLNTRRAVWEHFDDLGLDVFIEAMQVARCESGFRWYAHRTSSNPARTIGDRGLFQINSVHDGWLASRGIIERQVDLFDPAVNAEAARALYDRAGGWQDWFMSEHCHGQ